MKDSRADNRIARATISCSSSELNVHLAASKGRPFHGIRVELKLISGGCVSEASMGRVFLFDLDGLVGEGGRECDFAFFWWGVSSEVGILVSGIEYKEEFSWE